MMASLKEFNGRTGLNVDMKEPLKDKKTKAECEQLCPIQRTSKDGRQTVTTTNSSTGTVASFTTNHNSVVCLPLVSEGLKLVWTQSDQTRELDTIPELVQAFNLFPYPTSREVNVLARICALPLDKVKVWFMVQRIKYGISWSSEEIEETRRKLSMCTLSTDCTETKEEDKIKTTSGSCEEVVVADEEADQTDASLATSVPQKKKQRYESPDSYTQAKPAVPCFSSTLPPPEDSYYYRPPVDVPINTPPADVSLDLSESSTQQRRHGRYKKSKAQLAALRSSFLRENWPAEAELRRLQDETGLSRNDIRKWFSDSRYQLRVGRGTLAAAQNYSHLIAAAGKDDQQNQPLPLISQKNRHLNGIKAQDIARANGIKASHFFQAFLSNSLEAFGERLQEEDAAGYEPALEISDAGDNVKEEEENEDKPLELTKSSQLEPDVPPFKSSPWSSPSGSPPQSTSPNKQFSECVITPRKSAHSPKATSSQTHMRLSGTSSSNSSTLTPAGRPRKTKQQLDVLKQYFLRCQWPKSEEYTELVKLTGLPRADVIQWFGDTRYAVKNGQLRWVKGVREQFLAELANQQSSSGYTNGNGSGSATRGTSSRKRKLQANGTSADSPDVLPLVAYYHSTGVLHEKDLDYLCKKSRMSYQQVRDWFAAQEDIKEADPEANVTE